MKDLVIDGPLPFWLKNGIEAVVEVASPGVVDVEAELAVVGVPPPEAEGDALHAARKHDARLRPTMAISRSRDLTRVLADSPSLRAETVVLVRAVAGRSTCSTLHKADSRNVARFDRTHSTTQFIAHLRTQRLLRPILIAAFRGRGSRIRSFKTVRDLVQPPGSAITVADIRGNSVNTRPDLGFDGVDERVALLPARGGRLFGAQRRARCSND